MDHNTFNAIAALFKEEITPEERESLLQEIGADGDAFALISALSLAQEEDEPPPTKVVYPVAARIRAGVCGGFYRVFDSENLQLEEGIRSQSGLVNRISAHTLPVCIQKEIVLEVSIPPLAGQIRLTLEGDHPCGVFRFSPSKAEGTNGYIEVYENNVLRHALPVRNRNGEPLPLSPGAVISVRHSAGLECFSVRVAPVEFTTKDWVAASLFCALEGNFGEAVSILSSEKVVKTPLAAAARWTRALLETISGVAKVDGLALSPIAATRSTSSTSKSSTVLSPVVEGMASFCPEIKDAPSPRQKEEFGRFTGELPSEIRDILNEVAAAAEGAPLPRGPRSNSSDPRMEAAWAAFDGYVHLMAGEPHEALAALQSASLLSGDPFGVKPARRLAEHFAVISDNPSLSQETRMRGSEEIWKEVFGSLLSLKQP
jgi:hypothetical protein